MKEAELVGMSTTIFIVGFALIFTLIPIAFQPVELAGENNPDLHLQYSSDDSRIMSGEVEWCQDSEVLIFHDESKKWQCEQLEWLSSGDGFDLADSHCYKFPNGDVLCR